MLRAFVNLREKTGENYQITQLDQLTMFDNAEFSSWSSPNGVIGRGQKASGPAMYALGLVAQVAN